MYWIDDMKILLIGQTTLHWGRMEFGNIGNYYIIEPFIRELHKVFPEAEIRTTLQMSDRFNREENITKLPIELYYSWDDEKFLDKALKELAIADIFSKTSQLVEETMYINEVLYSDLVIDFSGDIWGDNADFVGKDRFLIGLIKDRIAQLLNKKTVMLTGSPGPFKNQNIKEFAKLVYESFDLVTNREPISTKYLFNEGFKMDKTFTLPCPSFLFDNKKKKHIDTKIHRNDNKKIGFILCGWNFIEGPFNKSHRENEEFDIFAKSIEYISEELRIDVYLMSHSNGFPIPPKEFKLQHGRDYLLIEQLYKYLKKRGNGKRVHLVSGVFDSWDTKTILGKFDMVISGRVHGAIASLSQCVPTVMIDYGHEPKAHKIKGFAQLLGIQDYVADPSNSTDLIDKIYSCWNKRKLYKDYLRKIVPKIKKEAKQNFMKVREVFYGK